MSLYKPKNSPYWHYDFQIEGVRLRGPTRVSDKREARKIADKVRLDYIRGIYEKRQPTMIMAEVAHRFWEHKGRHEKASKTVWGQLCRIVDRLKPSTRLDHVTSGMLADYIATRKEDETSRRAPPSNATINREIQLLRRIVNFAEEVWEVATPKIAWKRLHQAEAAERKRHLSYAEERSLVNALQPDLATLVKFCVLTGARLSSATRLTWSDVDLEAERMTFRDMKSRQTGRTHTLPITPPLRALLDSVRGQYPIYVLSYLCRRTTTTRQKGERYPFSASGWRRHWKAALQEAKIADLRFHDTRHTAGTRITNEAGLRVAQRVLDHASIQTTVRYSHVENDDVARGMSAAAELAESAEEETSQTIPEKKRAAQGRP